ncbi:acyltransferase family protein [Escherichia coli]|uniref:acyltransferase family protein n=1 Tax=Escherichia coli TaxID=562 RepID=UPI00200C1E9F|nr:acyltransferase [Escherichia coli]
MRNNSLDLAKFVACGLVVSLHVGVISELGEFGAEAINAIARLAVPFFFISSGYLFGISKNKDILKNVDKLASVFIASCVLYAGLTLVLSGFKVGPFVEKVFDVKTLYVGTYFHLWFICSMTFGYLILRFFDSRNMDVTATIISFIILFAAWWFDVVRSKSIEINTFFFFREIMSFSFLWIGVLIARTGHKLKLSSSISLLLVSIAAIVAEEIYLKETMGYDVYSRQLPLFSIVAAYASLMLCISINIRENLFSNLGKKYSLGIYIIHPIWIMFYFKLMSFASINYPSLVAILSLVSSAISLAILRMVSPKAFSIINGS